MTEEFKVLTDREHILQRPGMYAGSVILEPISGIIDYKYQTKQIVPALMKCVEEILQNSIDEHIRTSGEYATKIDVQIENTIDGTEITITDNGRGIPVQKIGNHYRPVLAWTELRAGSNFDDSKGRVTAGAHGMGSAICNTLSNRFIGISQDGTNKIVVTCTDNMATVEWKVSKSTVRGTQVKFIPDLTRFGLDSFTTDHIDVLKDRLNNLAILYPKISFSFNREKVVFKNIRQIAKNFHENAVFQETPTIGLVFAPAGTAEEFRCLSYVNGIYVKNGGAHVDFMMDKVISTLRESIKKKHKIDVLPNQIRQHLLFASWINGFQNLKFDSQTKERITNTQSEVSSVLNEIDFESISKKILNTPDIIDPIIAAILFRKELAEKQALAKKQKQSAKIRVVNHIAATDTNPENRTLFIAEGLSAIGPLLSVRDAKRVGGYPLKGKPMNVRGMKFVDIMKNKELVELMSIIGLTLGEPATNLNYGRIALFTDADPDGQAICSLMMNFFSLWPELFEKGRIVRALSPLYYCTKGKDARVFYTKNEFDQFNSTGYTVEYFKGLGTMPEEVYNTCINSPHFLQIEADDLSKLEMAFGDDANQRKVWLTA